MPAARLHNLRRSHLQAWLLTAAVGLLIVAVIAVTGGFRRGEPYLGRPVELGTQVNTQAWDFTAFDAVITGTPGATRLAVLMQIRSKLTESHRGITQQALIVRLPDGELMHFSVCSHANDAVGQGTFDPFVRSDAVCIFDPVYHVIDYQFTGDTEIELVVLDQAESAYDFERSGELEATMPVAYYAMTARWAVTG